MKRFLAVLLCLSMLLSVLPMGAAAREAGQPAAEAVAQETDAPSRLEALAAKEEVSLYDPETMVTVIVELEGGSVLDSFQAQTTQSVGAQVSAHLAASADQQAQLLAQQNKLTGRIQAVTDARITANWTGVTNAMAVRMPYGDLEAVRALDGVRNAYVEKVYDRPAVTLGDTIAGTHGYSYNMTNLAPLWNEGYTGQGMLIAVLDTGLDMTYTSWGYADDLRTGVRRVHEAFTEDSFYTEVSDLDLRYTAESMAAFLQAHQLRATTGSQGQKITLDGLYKNLKVPYACDYADGDVNVQPTTSDHGTHVSGTIAGYAKTGEGEVKFSGVAPDAQLLSMKVFPDEDGGATESSILNALEDAAALGADVVNLSLGSDNGFAQDDSAASQVYARLNAAGIVFLVSAGNSGTSSYMNNYGSYNLTSDPETSMMSSPAVYDGNLSIASVNNTVNARSVMTWVDGEGTEHQVPYQDPTDVAMKYGYAGQTLDVILVEGYGTYEDYYNAGFRSYYGYEADKGVSGIALVKRGGGISFTDKVNRATQFVWSYYDSASYTYVYEMPIKAVLVYDEDPNSTELIYMSVDNAGITSAFISGVDGHALAEACRAGSVRITIEQEDVVIEAPDGGQMSSFSTWGAGPGLELKPEITAPGGNIWSAVSDQTYSPSSYEGVFSDYEGSYAMMSGTSMAAPHMTGIAALLGQVIRDKYGITAQAGVGALTRQLLVSTAVPQTDANGVYYSPRQQGAGLVNAAAAMNSPAYVSVDGQSVGKLELKDDPQRTGSYAIDFDVNNLSGEEVRYNAVLTLLRPDSGTVETAYGDRQVMLEQDVLIKTLDLGTVTVPAQGTTSVSRTVTLTAEEKAALDETFENGVYVEGFVVLTDADGVNPSLSVPMLAFYGDWTAAPIFDSSVWYDEPADGENVMNNESTWNTTFIGSMVPGVGYMNLGQNLFDPYFSEQGVYHVENFTISPNGDGYADAVNDFVLYQLREAKLMVVEVKDAVTGETYFRDWATYQFKTLYDGSYGVAIPSSQYYFTQGYWDGTDANGNVLPSGTQCVMTVTAYGEGDYGTPVYEPAYGQLVTDFESIIPGENEPTFNGHEMDKTGDVLEFPIVVDTVAPKLENNTVTFYQEDGRTYMTGTVYDVDGSIASVEILPQVSRRYAEGYGDPSYVEYGLDDDNPFYVHHVYDAAAKELTFTCDVTEYAHTNESWEGENYYYQFDWTGNVYISCGDYGLNDRTYAVKADSSKGLVLSQTSALLYVGGSFELSVNDNTGVPGQLVRASSNPEVATIDEFGLIQAIAPGQTTITVTKGDITAVCVVAVREPETEVIDFKLSIDSFSGLKPNGTLVVRVTDLEPANVALQEVRWVVTEDDPDLYAGLINVARYDTTGLAGEIYLNYSATGDPSMEVPGASGTLAVTLNGVTRTMHIDWEDLYTYSNDEDLVSAANFYDQSVYVTQGETASLVARYNDSSAHNVCDVKLYTAVGAKSYSYSNPAEPALGLVLDGPDFAPTNSTWSGRLVNQEGYALPDAIRVFNRYSYSDGSSYESELINYSYYPYYSYDPATGEIEIFSTPYSETNTLVIRADGVESAGTPAGELSGETYTRPDGIYGPFNWTVLSGQGELTTAEGVTMGYETQNLAYFTPSQPGLSIIRAESRDGSYGVNFAVISQGILPEKLELSAKNAVIAMGETLQLTAALTPEPTLEQHARVTWTSFDPQVATVDPDTGLVTGHQEGYAYILASTSVDTGLEAVCVVQVCGCFHEQTHSEIVEASCQGDGFIRVTCADCGEVLRYTVLPGGHDYETTVTEGTCTTDGYTTYTCTVCGESHVEDVISAPGHDYVTTTAEPTETAEGYTQHSCTVCGYTYRDDIQPRLPCPAEGFEDVDLTRWYHEALDYVLTEGLMNGVSDTRFHPDAAADRAQVVTVLYRLAGSPAVEGSMPFADVDADSYCYDAVLWAWQNGIAKGLTADTFGPKVHITRQQLVTFLYRWAGSPETEGTLEAFPDAACVSGYALDAMTWAVSHGILQGMDGTLAPEATATRAQLAALLMRAAK